VKPVLNLVCYVSLCEGLRAGAGSLSYIVHVDCCGLSTIAIKKIIIIIKCLWCSSFVNTFNDLCHILFTRIQNEDGNRCWSLVAS